MVGSASTRATGCELRHLIGDGTVEQAVGLGHNRQRRQRHQQRVAVRLGARGGRIADRSAGASSAIVHDHGLAENALQRQRDRTRRKIGLSAGGKRDDHGDGGGQARPPAHSHRGTVSVSATCDNGSAAAAFRISRRFMFLPHKFYFYGGDG